MTQRQDQWIALSLALFTLAQTGLLDAFHAIPEAIAFQVWLWTVVLAALAAQAWRVRHVLPAHADMLLLMLAWGGFGMLWGWQLDGGLSSMIHRSHGGMHTPVYTGWFRWVNAMNGLMLLFAFPPSIPWARCLWPYRPFPWRLAWVLLLDAVGMILGMMAGGRLLGHPLGIVLDAPALAHHIGMLAGMLAGMFVTMLARPWLAPLPRRIH